MNSNLPYRWSPASLTFNNYFYLFPHPSITGIIINNNAPHLKSPKNQNRRGAPGRPAMKLLEGFNQPAVDQPSPLTLPWFHRHPAVRPARKTPSHHLRNREIKMKSKTKETRGLTETPTLKILGWSGGAMVLGKLLVPGRPTNLDYGKARAFCACRRCGWGLFGHFFSHLSFLYSFSLSLGDGPI